MMDDPLICHSTAPDTVIDDNHRKEALIDNHNVRLLLISAIASVNSSEPLNTHHTGFGVQF